MYIKYFFFKFEVSNDFKNLFKKYLLFIFLSSKYRKPKSINWKHNSRILMDSVNKYTWQWFKRKKIEVATLPTRLEL